MILHTSLKEDILRNGDKVGAMSHIHQAIIEILVAPLRRGEVTVVDPNIAACLQFVSPIFTILPIQEITHINRQGISIGSNH